MVGESIRRGKGIQEERKGGGRLTHLTHADGECAYEIQLGLLEPALRDLILQRRIFARDLGYGREEQMGAVR